MGLMGWILCCALAATAAPGEPRALQDTDLDFRGPAAPAAAAKVEEVRIGLLTDLDGPHAKEGRELLAGAELAAAAVNAEGGLGGRNLRIVALSSSGPWSQTARRAVELIHGQEVWAILAGPDRGTAHLALQVGHKAHTPVLLPVCEDRSVTLAGTVWAFRLAERPLTPATPKAVGERWRDAEQVPTPRGLLAWDAVHLVAAGLKARGFDRVALREWLASVKDYGGATGSIAFCPNGDRRGLSGCPAR